MTAEDNKRLIQRVFKEGVSGGDMAVLDEAFSANGVFRSGSMTWPHSPEIIKHNLHTLRDLLPDLQAQVEYIVAEDEQVATVERWSGTSRHTNEHAEGTVFHQFRFADGKVVEEWADGLDWADRFEAGPIPSPLFTTRTWVFKPGHAEQGRAALEALDHAARNIPGVAVRLFQDRDQPERFVTLGAWPSSDAFAAFVAHPDTARAGDAIAAVLAAMYPEEDAPIFMSEIENKPEPS